MERRTAARIATSCPVSYVGDRVVGSGQVYNLSPHGCAIGGYASVPAGAQLRLNLHLTGDDPVLIELGAVRWTADFRFGVEFLLASQQDQARLNSHLRGLTSLPPPGTL